MKSNARVLRFEQPEHFHVLLRDASGNYLGSADGAALACFDHVDDKAIWDGEQAPGTLHHVASGLEIQLEAAGAGGDYHVLHADQPVGDEATSWVVERGPAQMPSHYLQEFVAHGWVCLPSIIGPDSVAELESIAGAGKRSRRLIDWTTPALVQGSAVASVATEPVSLWLTRQYLHSDDIRLAHTPSLAVLDPDDGKRDVQGWHTDFPYLWGSPSVIGGDRVPPGACGELAMGVQRNVCISEFTRSNGATCFKLGSHALNAVPDPGWGNSADYAVEGHRARHGLPYDGPQADLVEAPAGSVILYDARTWHRAGINHTEDRRAAMLQAMTPMYVMPFKDTSAPYKAFIRSPLVAELNPRERNELARLMVHKIVGPEGQHAVSVDAALSA